MRKILALLLALGAALGLGACSHETTTMGVADFPDGHPGQVVVSKCGDVLEQIGQGLPSTRYFNTSEWTFRLNETDDGFTVLAVVYTWDDGSLWVATNVNTSGW